MEYKLIVESNTDKLNHKVNELLKEDWQLYGEHQVSRLLVPRTTQREDKIHERYSQALIKHTPGEWAQSVRESMDVSASI